MKKLFDSLFTELDFSHIYYALLLGKKKIVLYMYVTHTLVIYI